LKETMKENQQDNSILLKRQVKESQRKSYRLILDLLVKREIITSRKISQRSGASLMSMVMDSSQIKWVLLSQE
jgi:hypothetical protein